MSDDRVYEAAKAKAKSLLKNYAALEGTFKKVMVWGQGAGSSDAIKQDMALFFRRAEEDLEAHLGLRYGIAHRLEVGEELPEELRNWLIRYLRGEDPVPSGKSGRKKNVLQPYIIAVAVETIRGQFDLPAMRNDASPPFSACDAVAEALKELGLAPTKFSSVKRLYLRGNRRRVEQE